MTCYFLIPDRFDTRMDKSTYLEIAYELNKKGVFVKILTSFSKDKYCSTERNIHPVYFSSVNIPFLYRIIVQFKMLAYLLRNGRKDDIAIVSPESLFAGWMLRKLGKMRLHLDLRTLPVVLKKSLKEKIDHFLFFDVSIRLFAKAAQTCSFITKQLMNEVESRYGLHPNTQCIWSSGVSLDRFVSEPSTEHIHSGITLLYHGTLTETRGIGLLYDAFRMLLADEGLDHDIKLTIVGDGPYFGTLRQRVQTDGLESKVLLTGYVPYEDVVACISHADICVCPLPDRLEWNVSSPLKLLEYMALGKPIVCTDIPAHRHILNGQPYAVFSEASVEVLANSLLFAVQNLGALRMHSGQARHLVEEKYTWEKQAGVLAACLESVYDTGKEYEDEKNIMVKDTGSPLFKN